MSLFLIPMPEVAWEREQKHVYHTLAGNGASRRGLQARLEPSTCDFKVIFNARAILVSQPRQFSVSAASVYSSSTTSSMFCGRSNVLAFRFLLHFVLG